MTSWLYNPIPSYSSLQKYNLLYSFVKRITNELEICWGTIIKYMRGHTIVVILIFFFTTSHIQTNHIYIQMSKRKPNSIKMHPKKNFLLNEESITFCLDLNSEMRSMEDLSLRSSLLALAYSAGEASGCLQSTHRSQTQSPFTVNN